MSKTRARLQAKIELQSRRIEELEATMKKCAEIIDSGERTPRTEAEERVLAKLVLIGEGVMGPEDSGAE